MQRQSVSLVIVRTVLAVLLFSPLPAFTANKPVEPGVWGGENLIMTVTENGAELEFQCARGQITQPINLDGDGNFEVEGAFVTEGRGPTRDISSADAKVRYSGHVEAQTMTLSMTRGEEKLGPYTLTHGREPILKKCR